MRFTAEGLDALRLLTTEESDDPWRLLVGCVGPHDRYYVPRKYLDMYDPNDIELPQNFADDMRDRPNFYRRTKDLFDQLTPEEHKESIRHYLA